MYNIYNLGTIKVGRSRRFDISTAVSIRQAAHDYGKRHGHVYAVRIERYTSGNRFVRVYRVR